MNLGEVLDKWELEKIQECVDQIPWDHEMVYHTCLNILKDSKAEIDREKTAMSIANEARKIWMAR